MMDTNTDRRANGDYPRSYQFVTSAGCVCIVIEGEHGELLYSSSAGWLPAGVREIADRA